MPIVETQEDDITSFIPTNIISITDGQIYLGRSLFQKNFLPAVNIGLSISRIGSQAQPKVLTEVVGGIRLALSQHQELQRLSELETNLNLKAQADIKRGNILIEFLKQEKHTNLEWPEQAILFYAIHRGLFDDLDREKLADVGVLLGELIKARHQDILKQIKVGIFDERIKEKIAAIIADFKQRYI